MMTYDLCSMTRRVKGALSTNDTNASIINQQSCAIVIYSLIVLITLLLNNWSCKCLLLKVTFVTFNIILHVYQIQMKP